MCHQGASRHRRPQASRKAARSFDALINLVEATSAETFAYFEVRGTSMSTATLKLAAGAMEDLLAADRDTRLGLPSKSSVARNAGRSLTTRTVLRGLRFATRAGYE